MLSQGRGRCTDAQIDNQFFSEIMLNKCRWKLRKKTPGSNSSLPHYFHFFVWPCNFQTSAFRFNKCERNGGREGGGERWVEKETQLRGDGGITFSFQALGDSLTEGEAGVVSPLVHSCLNRVRVLLIPCGSFLSSRSEQCLKINYKVCTMA